MGDEASAGRPVLASLAEDGSVALWDVQSRELIESWTTQSGARHVAVLPLEEGPVIAVASRETVTFYDPGPSSALGDQRVGLSLDDLRYTVPPNTTIKTISVLTMPWGPDLALGLEDGTVVFVAAGETVSSGLEGSVDAIADGEVDGRRVLVVAGGFGQVRMLWDPRRTEPAEWFEADGRGAIGIGTVSVDRPDTWQPLQKGSTGPAVRDLQARLRAAGRLDLVIDGEFGEATDAALRDYQRDESLPQDGLCGERTWTVLLEQFPVPADAEVSVRQLTAVGIAPGAPVSAGHELVVAATRVVNQPAAALELTVWDAVTGDLVNDFVVDDVLREVSGGVRAQAVAARAFPLDVPPVFEILTFRSPATSALDSPIAVGQWDGSVQVFHDGRRRSAPLVHHEAPVVALSRGFVQATPGLSRPARTDSETPGKGDTPAGKHPSASRNQRLASADAVQDPASPDRTQTRDRQTPREPVTIGADGTPASASAGVPDAKARARAAANADRVRASAGFQADRVDHDGEELPDHLRVADEVEALCSVIMHRDVRPPVSVGLFGDWGSGKTYFMALMQRRIAALRQRAKAAEQAGEETVYCSEVAQIRFNAWHFVDTNLWASIVTRIFEGLAEHYTKSEATRWDEVLEETETMHDQLKKAHEETKKAEKAEKEADGAESRAREALEKAESNYEEAKQQAVDAKAVARTVLHDGVAARQVADAAGELGLSQVPRSLDEVEQQLRQSRTVVGRLAILWRSIGGPEAPAIRRLGMIAVLVAAVVGPAVVVWVITAELAQGARAVITGVTTWLLMGLQRVLVVRPWLEVVERGIARLETAVDIVQREITDAPRREVAERWEDLQHARTEHEVRKAYADALRARKAEAKARAERIRTGAFVADLIRERSDDPAYRSKLGIIDVIRRDFQGLSKLRLSSKDGVRLDRIVLYIDDLDRCPSDRVVEVLQAVHLLLAFELFVVVVGVDSRWLLHALTEQYSAFGGRFGEEHTPPDRGSWTTTPQHYLEKIFQIPLTLRPMNRTGFTNLVEAMTLVPSNGRPAGRTGEDNRTSDEHFSTSSDDAPLPGELAARTGSVPSVVPVRAKPAETDPALDPSSAHPMSQPTEGPGRLVDGGSPEAGPRSPDDHPPASAQWDTSSVETAMTDSQTSVDVVDDASTALVEHAPTSDGGAEQDGAIDDVVLEVAAHQGSGTGSDDAMLIDPLPPQLKLTPDERAFMVVLDGLIPTPRAAKRFVNLYRLIKATLPLENLQRFEGDSATPGEYQAAMLLLALQAGHPAEAAALFPVVHERKGRWWDLIAELGEPLREGETPSDVPWRRPDEGRIGEGMLRWRRLRLLLEEQKEGITLDDDVAIYARHVGTVARYGFLTGRTVINDRT
jgi:hypothetical protein